MKLRDPIHNITIERDVPTTMRDGTVLRSAVFRPDVSGTFPVLITRTPYGADDEDSEARAKELAQRGYIAVRQDIRGRHASEGTFGNCYLGSPHQEVEDGYDAVQWAATLPGSNGRVGTFGISYDGWTMWPLAASRPPALRAISSGAVANEPQDYHLSGIWRPACMLMHVSGLSCDLRRRHDEWDGPRTESCFGRLRLDALHHWIWTLPFSSLPSEVICASARPAMDDFWQQVATASCGGPYHENVAVPCQHIWGWHDPGINGYKIFNDMRQGGASEAAQAHQQLIIGPWRHNVMRMDRVEGEIDFGENADWSYTESLCRWYDRWLGNGDNDPEAEAPVRLFVMGIKQWHNFDSFPLPNVDNHTYYLHSGGSANTPTGDGTLDPRPPAEEPHDQFIYNPRHPVPSLLSFINQPTPRDQALLDHRHDILVYESAPLTRDLDIIGHPRATLFAASSAVDTDFFVKLIDVYPDGKAINICMGVVRARHRAGLDREDLLLPEEPTRFDIELMPTANRFFAGHRLRVVITSSDFPDFDRNHNTGRNNYTDAELQTACNTVFHDANRPSRIDLPVADL